jgi:signal transduction histidine kinase
VTRTVRIQIAAATAFWAAVSALYTGQLIWLSNQLGERGQPLKAIAWTGSMYLYWIPLTVIVWRVTTRWTPPALGWPRYLAQHLLVALTAAAIHNAITTAGVLAFFAPPNEGFWDLFPSAMRSRSYVELIIYTGVVASGQAAWMYERWRDRDAQAARFEAAASKLEAQLSAAKLSALEAQVQPHFLFNSLHTIASLARDGRNADVVRLIADLSDLLRAVTDQHQSTRPLADEAALAQRYLDIQQVRFGDRLRVSVDIAPGAERIPVPTLTLQPLVDNAIRHGISNVVRGGSVAIRAIIDPTSLVITVEDDGVGAAVDWSLDSSDGTGLKNLRSRLALLYGERAGLVVLSPPGGGFRATVRIPKGSPSAEAVAAEDR